MQKKRNAIMAVLAVVLVAALTIGGTLAYMTDSESLTNVFKVGDLDVSINEPNYPTVCDTDDRVPGDSFPKDPTVKLWKGSAYMRIHVEFLEGDGSSNTLITDTARLDLIKTTLYYDKNFSGTADAAGYKGSSDLYVYAGGAHTPSNVRHYTEAQLLGKVNNPAGPITSWFNRIDFVLDTDATDIATKLSSAGSYYLIYQNALTNNIFNTATPAVKVFTSVVFPSDWNQTELQKMGSYAIKITVEVIQSQGFADRNQAFESLNAEARKLVNYEVTSNVA